MIRSIFLTIAEEMNEYFSAKYSLSEEKVVISSLAEGSDNSTLLSEDKLLISLVNIEQEKVSFNTPSIGMKPMNLYIYILFSAGFTEGNYEEALKLLSGAVGFFQSRKVFNQQNTPSLNAAIEKLSFDMINMNIQELSQLWSIHGGKYYPSTLFRAKVIRIEEDGFLDDTTSISGFGGGAFNR